MSTPATEKWGKLTRRELSFLDAEGLEMVLIAMELGAEARISTGNHVILRAKSGETMSISRNLSSRNRAAQNARAQFKRIFGITVEQGKSRLTERMRRERAAVNERERQAAAQAVADHQEKADQRTKYVCTTKACPQVFFDRDELIEHIKASHITCRKFPDECMFSDDRTQSVSAHYRIVHEGMAPRRGTGAGAKVTIEDKPLPRGREDWIRMTRELNQRIVAAVRGSNKRQGEIAQEIGMDPTALSKVMNGTRHISAVELRGIATATGTTVDALLGEPPRRKEPEPEEQTEETAEVAEETDTQVEELIEVQEAIKAEESLKGLEAQMDSKDYVTVKKPTSFEELVAVIQALLPATVSAREQELEAELAQVKREFDDLQAKVALLKETLGL